MNLAILRDYISEYEREFEQIHNKEIYKWQAVKQFQDTWNPDAEDFAEMLALALSKTNNLMAAGNYYPREMIVRVAKERPQRVKQLFVDLFDEEADLLDRIGTFQREVKNLNESLFEYKNHFQDDRAILVYLSLRFPEIYYFYKFEMFKEFCEKVESDFKPKRGQKSNIVQFLEMCSTIRDEIRSNNNLLKLHKDRIKETEYFDAESNILTQDFIYAVTYHLTPIDKAATVIIPKLHLKQIDIKALVKQYKFKGSFIDHVSKQKRDKRIGDIGEQLVMQYEKDNCSPKFLTKIDHASKSTGDGLGYDILSVDQNGQEKYIEVKTTTGNLNRAFFITGTELERSRKEGENYFLYRLYNFDEKNMTADYFILQGDLSEYCINPIKFEVIIPAETSSRS